MGDRCRARRTGMWFARTRGSSTTSSPPPPSTSWVASTSDLALLSARCLLNPTIGAAESTWWTSIQRVPVLDRVAPRALTAMVRGLRMEGGDSAGRRRRAALTTCGPSPGSSPGRRRGCTCPCGWASAAPSRCRCSPAPLPGDTLAAGPAPGGPGHNPTVHACSSDHTSGVVFFSRHPSAERRLPMVGRCRSYRTLAS